MNGKAMRGVAFGAAFRARYGIDPLTPVYSTENDAMYGKLRMPILSAVFGSLDEDPTFDVDVYVEQWKEYWSCGAITRAT